MSYSNPQYITYPLGNQDFGGADDSYTLTGPPGKAGRVVEITALVTEVFTATTTAASLQVGTSADPDAYAILTFGTDAVDDFLVASAGSTATKRVETAQIPAGAAGVGASFDVDIIATTGGTPTGQAEVSVTVAWS